MNSQRQANKLNENRERSTLRRIASIGNQYRRQIFFLLAVVGLDSLLGVVPPLLYKLIVDEGILAEDSTTIILLAIALLLIAAANALFITVQRWQTAKIGEQIICDLRTQVFDHVLAMPLSFFSHVQTGRLVSRLNSDIAGAQNTFSSTLINSVSSGLTFVTSLAAMLALSWQIAIASLALFPLFYFPVRAIGKRLDALVRTQMEETGLLAERMTERFSVGGAILVKLFGRPEHERRQFAAHAASLRDTSVAIAMNGRVFMTGLSMLGATAVAIVYGVGGLLSISGAASIGTLTFSGRVAERP